MRIPDFFIVGAPKCGTTAMYEYLRAHPDVFMPFVKEPLFFGDDLTRRYGRLQREEYLGLFRDARPEQRVGEASSWYLYSRSAAREIRDFSPDARIIIMLRDPVEMMRAQHSQLLYNQQEDIADFAGALEAEPARREGRRLPPGPVRVETLLYRDSARFAEQVARYLEVFGREQVHIVIFDDLVSDPETTYRAVLRSLGLADVALDPRRYNPNKEVRIGLLQRLVFRPPGPILRLAPTLRRFRAAHRIRSFILAVNSRVAAREPVDPELLARLRSEFAPELERLSALIGRDVTYWAKSTG